MCRSTRGTGRSALSCPSSTDEDDENLAPDPNGYHDNPGIANSFGEDKNNRALDYLTPHTVRQSVGRHWEVAPLEVAYLPTPYHQRGCVDAILGGEAVTQTGAENLKTLAATFAAYEAAASGRVINIAETDGGGAAEREE